MFSRSSGAAAKVAPGLSFIGAEMVVTGHLTTSGQVHIDGRIEGDVRCATLCQGRTGIVVGSVTADEVRVAGLVEGKVAGANIVLEPSARITGDVDYQTISIAAGAQVEGRLTRTGASDTSNVIAPLFPSTPAVAAR